MSTLSSDKWPLPRCYGDASRYDQDDCAGTPCVWRGMCGVLVRRARRAADADPTTIFAQLPPEVLS